MFGLGIKEIIIIAVVILLLFGLTKLPALLRNIVESIKIIKAAFKK
jgi:TatA/E family protein of Tat protein translocase